MASLNDRMLADAVAAIVRTADVADGLLHVVVGCAEAYPSEAVAVLARNDAGSLELLSASSHRAEELELLQIQHRQGPCVDAMKSDSVVISTGRDDLVARWGSVGTAIADAGFDEVHAFPMHWRGTAIGGLNIFVRPDQPTDPTLGQLFADLATLAILHGQDLRADQLLTLVRDAVTKRAVIEQAKGVLVHRLKISMESAYDELVSRARASGTELTAVARRIVSGEYHDPTPGA